ncbi:MBL fold metallo-hydrolase [Candidatus Poribacteria bacterium]|nr:MBL fold metallo-hydrolase [Candidatus Poribacteria bacterium]
MSQKDKLNSRTVHALVFLGTSGAFQIPVFFCLCKVCEAARRNLKHRRTRASIALLGEEIVIVDAGPDLEFQLEREAIRHVDRIFITHWHYDHVWGLGSLGEPASCAKWPQIEVYLPEQVAYHFDQELAYMKKEVNLHPIHPGDKFELPDATWEVVKTTHTEHSVGFIVEGKKRFAYLVDSVMPPPETLERLKELDFLILEATVDELSLRKGEKWFNFSLQQAVDCWKHIGAERCILTHLSCHSWKDGRLVAGLEYSKRLEYEAKIPNLKFAYEGMRLAL